MTPTATKRKSPDDQPQGEQSFKRAKLHTPNIPDSVEGEIAEEEQEVSKLNPPPAKPAANQRKIKKLTPPRPFPTVPTSVSATAPRSARSEGKNYICITRKTPLAAYLRRCKDVIMVDGSAAPFLILLTISNSVKVQISAPECDGCCDPHLSHSSCLSPRHPTIWSGRNHHRDSHWYRASPR